MSDHGSKDKKEWWSVGFGIGVPTAMVGTAYWWLWYVANLQDRGLDEFGPSGLGRLALMGDSFGVLTSLFASLAFGFSWLTNRSQNEELKSQRAMSEKQLRIASEAAYAQRLQSLRIEAETFGNFVVKVQQALVDVHRHWKHLTRVIAERKPYFYSEEYKRIEGSLSSILADTYELPFEDPSVEATSIELMDQGRFAVKALGESLKLFHVLDGPPPEFDGPKFDLQGIRNGLGAAQKAMSNMEESMEHLKSYFRLYYGHEADRLKEARDEM